MSSTLFTFTRQSCRGSVLIISRVSVAAKPLVFNKCPVKIKQPDTCKYTICSQYFHSTSRMTKFVYPTPHEGDTKDVYHGVEVSFMFCIKLFTVCLNGKRISIYGLW